MIFHRRRLVKSFFTVDRINELTHASFTIAFSIPSMSELGRPINTLNTGWVPRKESHMMMKEKRSKKRVDAHNTDNSSGKISRTQGVKLTPSPNFQNDLLLMCPSVLYSSTNAKNGAHRDTTISIDWYNTRMYSSTVVRPLSL